MKTTEILVAIKLLLWIRYINKEPLSQNLTMLQICGLRDKGKLAYVSLILKAVNRNDAGNTGYNPLLIIIYIHYRGRTSTLRCTILMRLSFKNKIVKNLFPFEFFKRGLSLLS